MAKKSFPVLDLYRILAVERSASREEIKSAYRGLALKYHPDQSPDNPQAEKRFRLIAGAYGTLSDPSRRKFYDRFGVERAELQNEALALREQKFQGFFSDLVDEVLRRSKRKPEAGKDHLYRLSVGFEEAALGKCEKAPVREQLLKEVTGYSTKLGPNKKPLVDFRDEFGTT